MKILLICDRYPFPLTNGQNLRVFHLTRFLMQSSEVDLLSYGPDNVPSEVISLFRKVYSVPPPNGSLRETRSVHSPWKLLSPTAMIQHSEYFRSELAAHLHRGQYDLLWMEGWETVVNLPPRLPLPFLADIIDDGVLEHWNELCSSIGAMQRIRMAKRLIQNFLFERRYFSRADHCVTVSERDARVLRRVTAAPVTVIHNGVDSEFFHPSEASVEPATLVFEGSMEFRPNVDAARYLVEKILPLVRRYRPEARVLLVGRDPSPEVLQLRGDHVSVTGFVDDIRPYLGGGTVFVAPMRKGAGIKNKILQAWAMEKPVVATPMAVGGLRAIDGNNVIIRRTSEAISDAVVKLLDRPDEQRRIGKAGRETVLAHYGWAQKAVELNALMRSLVRTRDRNRG